MERKILPATQQSSAEHWIVLQYVAVGLETNTVSNGHAEKEKPTSHVGAIP